MFRHKKTAAFVLSLLICASCAAAPVVGVYATESVEATSEEISAGATEEATEEETTETILSSGDFTYEMTNDDTICITGYTGSDTALVIPDELDGIAVTEIGENAFLEGSFTSVHIPAGVEFIYENPFLECTALTEITVDKGNSEYYAVDGVLYWHQEDGDMVSCYPQGKTDQSYTIPDGITKIGVAAIYDTKLEEIKFPSTLEAIERHGVSYNEKLDKIDLSGTKVSSMGDMTAAYCIDLTEVIFPETLYDIGGAAFAGCKRLNEVELPENLVTIGQNAFAATGLDVVTIPASVIEIGYCAFGYDENLEPMDSFTIIGTTGSAAQTYCTDTDEDYDYANNFTFVDVENADLVLESMGFEYKTSGDYTYAVKDNEVYITACVAVGPTIEVPSEIEGYPVTRIYGGAFFQNQATKIVLPDTVKQLDDIAFYMCTNMKEIVLSPNLEIIENQVFSDCTSLEKIDIPSTVTAIGTEPFIGCTALKEINVTGEGGAYTSEDGVLYSADKSVLIAYPLGKEDKSYTAPDTVKEIMLSAFFGNSYIEKVDISSAITIGDYAFESCTALSSVKLSKDLEIIGEYAFYNCKELKSLRIYNNIQEINSAAIGFYYDANDTTDGGDVAVEGFKLYADEGSGGAQYAEITGLECVTGTVDVFGYNVHKGFLFGICGVLGAAILAVIGVITSKKIKKSKAEKAEEKLKNDAENTEGKDTENEDENEDK